MKLNYNFIKNGNYAPRVLVINGRQVHNPAEAMYLQQGYEKVQPHVLTEEELAEQQRQARIADLHTLLEESDYKAIKYAEGWISAADYATTKAERQAWRDEINSLTPDPSPVERGATSE